MSSEIPRRVHCHYTGRVQGVGFRETARRAVGKFADVTGYVRNLPDGRVELVAEGPPEAVERALAAVQRQMAGHVDDVARTDGEATGEFDDFTVRR